MRPMTDKSPGRCECGNHVPAGAGQAVKTAAGKWVVRCTHHGAEDTARIARAG